MMTLDEMKLAVAGKLPSQIEFVCGDAFWKDFDCGGFTISKVVFWPTEGLQVCHEAEKLLQENQQDAFAGFLGLMCGGRIIDRGAMKIFTNTTVVSATWEQRLEALCRVWWPERFQTCDPDAIDRAEYQHGRKGEP